jgi:putative exosortase-associated protein (TIGR04073 family)
MKTIFSLLILGVLAGTAMADIQDPPGNDYGPTRKLGRGLANLLFAGTELIQTPNQIQAREGDVAAYTYGPVRAIGRFFFRTTMGFYEVVTWPFPTTKASYRIPWKSSIPWIHGGMEEFPPELGFESRLDYIRDYTNGYSSGGL